MAVEATLFKEVEPTLFKFKRSTALFAVYSTFFFAKSFLLSSAPNLSTSVGGSCRDSWRRDSWRPAFVLSV